MHSLCYHQFDPCDATLCILMYWPVNQSISESEYLLQLSCENRLFFLSHLYTVLLLSHQYTVLLLAYQYTVCTVLLLSHQYTTPYYCYLINTPHRISATSSIHRMHRITAISSIHHTVLLLSHHSLFTSGSWKICITRTTKLQG